MMPPPTSFTSKTTRDGDCPGRFQCLVPLPCRMGHTIDPLILMLARRMIITLPRVMISFRRVMINPLGPIDRRRCRLWCRRQAG